MIPDSFWLRFLLGYSVTAVASTAAYPIDTIRRRMMMNSGGTGWFRRVYKVLLFCHVPGPSQGIHGQLQQIQQLSRHIGGSAGDQQQTHHTAAPACNWDGFYTATAHQTALQPDFRAHSPTIRTGAPWTSCVPGSACSELNILGLGINILSPCSFCHACFVTGRAVYNYYTTAHTKNQMHVWVEQDE